MTKEEILAMETGYELDLAIAYEFELPQAAKSTGKPLEVYCYSTDISAAYQVVEKMEAEGYGHKHLRYSQNRPEGVTWVFMQPSRGIFEARGRDIKEAICKAALLTRLDEIKRLEGKIG